MKPEDPVPEQDNLTPLNSASESEDYEALPPLPPPRGMVKPKLRIYHWILIALLLGGFVALLLVGFAAD